MQGMAGQRQSQASNALAGWHGSGSQAAAPQQQVGHISCTLAPVPDLGSPVYYSASHSFDAGVVLSYLFTSAGMQHCFLSMHPHPT